MFLPLRLKHSSNFPHIYEKGKTIQINHSVRTQGFPGLTGVRLTGLRSSNNNVFYITNLFTDKYKYL